MMDIVEELRADELPGERQSKREARMELGKLLDRAADEIERLRTDLNEAQKGEYRETDYVPTWAEITDFWVRRAAKLEQDLVVARYATTENERLREALRGLLSCPAVADGNHGEPAWFCPETVEAERKARAALGEEK